MGKANPIYEEEAGEHFNTRPYPPKGMMALVPERDFAPAPEITQWIRETLLDPESPLYNEEHLHLEEAEIGCLWTSVQNSKHQKDIMGTCEIPNIQGGKWLKARMEMQLREWFGRVPDFLLTFYAPFANAITNAEWCRLVEHEVYHAGQALDDYGMPKFRKDSGEPVFGIRGHDVEEFTGVVRRYGIGACHSEVREFVEAANREPEIARVNIASMCGTCLMKV